MHPLRNLMFLAGLLWLGGAVAAEEVLPSGAISRLQAGSDAEPAQAVLRLAYSPDGKFLASLHEDRQVRVWRTETGRVEYTLAPHRQALTALEFSPQGDRLLTAAAGPEESVSIWDAPTGKLLTKLAVSHQGATAARFIDGGKQVACLSPQGGGWFDSATGEQVRKSVAETGPIAISPDGKSVVRLLTNPMRLQVEEIFDQEAVSIMLSAGVQGPAVVDFSPYDGERLLIGKRGQPDCMLYRVYEYNGDVALDYAPLEGHEKQVQGSAFSADNLWVATASSDHTVRIWERLTMRPAAVISLDELEPTAAAFSPGGGRLAVGFQDGGILLWEVRRTLFPAPTEITEPTPEQMAGWWFDMASDEPAHAFKAVGAFCSHPAAAAKYFTGQLDFLKAGAAEADLQRWIRELDDNEFAVRQAADENLSDLRPGIDLVLRAALEKSTSAEPRNRLRQMLAAPMSQGDLDDAQRLQLMRCVLALETMSPAGRALLTRIAAVHPQPEAAAAAGAALERNVLNDLE
ncbi:WD40 repeat domain-containing protein [Lignipirellula cremea]|uniref:WD domain, G-beta repeat n=1 Tax=Lignipirellula cremea TaxID=2528010 RepID=A0A518DW61_9BACT|nr:hypothetical protein [Lignipirellula cremea]QDU96069.1 WD domain, G-beta repeat [Lignipirellula cremea]